MLSVRVDSPALVATPACVATAILCYIRTMYVYINRNVWYTPTKQGTSHTGLFWHMGNWKVGIGYFGASVNFEIFFFTKVLNDYSYAYKNKFWLIFKHFPSKNLHFLLPIKFKSVGRKLWRPISQNQNSREISKGLIHKYTANKYPKKVRV